MEKETLAIKKSSVVDFFKIEFSIAVFIFIALTVWFYYIHTLNFNSNEQLRQAWGSAYQIMAIFGGIIGLWISRKWGGYKSLLGRAVLFLSISLLFQSFGQSVNSYYNFFAHIDVPYPSLGDVGFMGSTICYSLGVLFLARASGFKFSFKSTRGKLIAVLIPLILLNFSYFFFLKGYEFDFSNKIKIFLDFGYPLGDAVYLSIAIITFLLYKNFLGGMMRKPIFLLVCALMFQYLVDFMFLYQASNNTWYVGGINDYLYFSSYFIMTSAIIYMGVIFERIQKS